MHSPFLCRILFATEVVSYDKSVATCFVLLFSYGASAQPEPCPPQSSASNYLCPLPTFFSPCILTYSWHTCQLRLSVFLWAFHPVFFLLFSVIRFNVVHFQFVLEQGSRFHDVTKPLVKLLFLVIVLGIVRC